VAHPDNPAINSGGLALCERWRKSWIVTNGSSHLSVEKKGKKEQPGEIREGDAS